MGRQQPAQAVDRLAVPSARHERREIPCVGLHEGPHLQGRQGQMPGAKDWYVCGAWWTNSIGGGGGVLDLQLTT
jgi:hypothetical protein